MIDDTPTTDDIVQKTHEELLQRIERTGVDLTALAGKIQREYESCGRIPTSEEQAFTFDAFKSDLTAYITHWNTKRPQERLDGYAPSEYRQRYVEAR